MAFMMPVVKNDYDIYKGGRSRRTSECTPCRSRKVSEGSKSEGPSLSTSPSTDNYNNRRNNPVSSSRQTSRSSRDSLQSPCKSSSSSSPPKSDSSSSLNKFHTRLVDRLKRSLKCKDSGELMVNQGEHHENKLDLILGRLEHWVIDRYCGRLRYCPHKSTEARPLLIAAAS